MNEKIYRGFDGVMAAFPSEWQYTEKYLFAMSIKGRLISSVVPQSKVHCEEVESSLAEVLSGEESLDIRHPGCKFMYAWMQEERLVDRVIRMYRENRHLEEFD
jgi:hypothetical protein